MNEGKKDRRDPIRTIKAKNPVAKNASAAIGGGAAGAHKDKKKAMKQGDVKHKKAEYAESYEAHLARRLDELSIDTLKSYKEKRQTQQDAAKAAVPNPRTGDKDWVGQAVRSINMNTAQRKINRKEKPVEEAGTRYTGNGIHPKLVEVLKQRGYKGPYQLGKLKKWFVHLKDDVGAQATDEIMVTGNDVEYDEWVLKEQYGEYAFGSEGGYMTGDANRVIKNTAPMAEQSEVAEEFDSPEYNDEAGMAQGNLHTLSNAVNGLLDTIDDNDNLPEWCQEKISKAEAMLVSVWNYLQSQKSQGIDPKVSEASALDQHRKRSAQAEADFAKREAERKKNPGAASGDRIKELEKRYPKEGWTHDSLADELFEHERTYEERLQNQLNHKLGK